MGLFKKLLGLQDIEVSGNLQVGTFRKRFQQSFGTEIRVYRPKSDGTINTGAGSRSADEKATLASIAANGVKVAEITVKKSKTVGEIECEFAKKMGIGIQIMTVDGKDFAPNEMRLRDVAANT